MALTWNQDGSFINFQSAGSSYAASGNTDTFSANYTLEFDMQVVGVNAGPYPQGFQISIFGPGGGVFSGPKVELDLTTNVFTAGQGFQHYAFTLDKFVPHNNFDPTAASFTVGFGIVSFGGPNTPVTGETMTIDNLQITMKTNPPPPPRPTMTVLPAKPGLRIFSKNYDFTFNQSGFGTALLNQSWIGVATPANPVSYSVTIADFDTVNNFTLYMQFLQNGSPGDPFGVYAGQNAFVWEINHQDTGFTTAINWKTNLPGSNTVSNALPVTVTGSTNGRGTWTLTFTNDTDGTVSAPDGTKASFVLPNDPTWASDFANPLIIDFGIAPNNTGGFGQWITLSKIAISNVVDGTQIDDFTHDDGLNTSLWNPAFSFPPGSGADAVVQISTNTPYWLNWTVPDPNYTLATKADLSDTSIPWYTPTYYGSGSATTNFGPSQMGPSLKWTLIPRACLPTTDGTVGGPASQKAFFRLQNPAPSQ
jgi:hypothetical protein